LLHFFTKQLQQLSAICLFGVAIYFFRWFAKNKSTNLFKKTTATAICLCWVANWWFEKRK